MQGKKLQTAYLIDGILFIPAKLFQNFNDMFHREGENDFADLGLDNNTVDTEFELIETVIPSNQRNLEN